MKRFFVLASFLIVTGWLTAQDRPSFEIQGGVNTLWIPFQLINRDEGNVMGSGLGRDTGFDGIQAVLGAIGETDTMGFKIELLFHTGYGMNAIGIGEWLTVWWNPIDFFKLELGRFNNEIFWGRIGDTWMDAFTVPMYGNDAIFTRFQGREGGGILAGFPINNLYIGVLVPSLGQFIGGEDILETVFIQYPQTDANGSAVPGGTGELGRVYETIQAAIGYKIDGIGLVRAQYVGANKFWDPKSSREGGAPSFEYKMPRIEAAFNLTAIEHLNLDIGFKYNFLLNQGDSLGWNKANLKWENPTGSNWSSYQAPMQVSFGGIWEAIDGLTINGRMDTKFLGSLDSTTSGVTKFGPQINIHLWPTYAFDFATLGLDVGFSWWGADTNGDQDIPDTGGTRFGIGSYLEKKWGGWTISGGLAYSLSTRIDGKFTASGTAQPKDRYTHGVFTIPIKFDYSY
jgi:hypothetical protein